MPSVRFRAICSIQSSFAELATPPISTSRVDRSMKDRTVNRCRPVHVHTSTVKKSVQCHTLQNICDRRACDPDPLGSVETINAASLVGCRRHESNSWIYGMRILFYEFDVAVVLLADELD